MATFAFHLPIAEHNTEKKKTLWLLAIDKLYKCLETEKEMYKTVLEFELQARPLL